MHKPLLPTIVSCALLLVGCASDEVSPPAGLPDPGLSNVATDNAAARGAELGASGGTLTATGTNGAVYTLIVPPDAIDSTVAISMYPITSMSGYPLASGVTAGVHLEPEGFVPRIPLTLTIDLPASASMASMATLASVANGADHQLYPAIIDGRRVTFTLTHFSQYTTGDATLDALLEVRTNQGASTTQFQNDLALKYITAQRSGERPAGSDYATLLNTWYTQVLVPAFAKLAAESDHVAAFAYLYTDLRDEYNAWLSAIDFCVGTAQGAVDVGASTSDARQRATTGILNTIILINAHLVNAAGTDPDGPSDAAVVDMAIEAGIALSVQRQAAVWDLDAATTGLDLESVLNSLPIKVRITSRSLPASFAPSSVGNLDVRAGVKILDRAVRTSPAVTVRLSNVQGGTVSPTSGQTNAQGIFRSTAQWTSGTTFSVDMIAAIEYPGSIAPALVRVFDRLSQTAGGTLQSGEWLDPNHTWIFHTGLERQWGLEVRITTPSGGHQLIASEPGKVNTGKDQLFAVPITFASSTFTGQHAETSTHSFFAGFDVQVSGSILPNGRLSLTWVANRQLDGVWARGSGELPPM